MGAEESVVTEKEVGDFFKAVDSNNLETVKKFMDRNSNLFSKSDHGVVQHIIKNGLDVRILSAVLNRLGTSLGNRICNGTTVEGEMVLFLAIEAGDEYLKAFEPWLGVNWQVFDEEGNNMLHCVYSERCMGTYETVDLLLEKLGGVGVMQINDECENILHLAAVFGKNVFFKHLNIVGEKYKPPNMFVKNLVNTVNLNGETPFVKLIKLYKIRQNSRDMNSDGDSSGFSDIDTDGGSGKDRNSGGSVYKNYSMLTCCGYDFPKSDENEENAISLAIKYELSNLKSYLMKNLPVAYYLEQKFAFLEANKLSERYDVAAVIREFCRTHPKRSAKFISMDATVLPNLIEKGKLRIEERLYLDGNNILLLAIKLDNEFLFKKCWDKACPELKKEAAFATARDGELEKLKALIEYRSDVLYEKAMSIRNEKFKKSKSLLEVAAENRQVDVVLYLLHTHKEFSAVMSSETRKEKELIFKDFIYDLLDRSEPWAKNLSKYLAGNLIYDDEQSDKAIKKLLSKPIVTKKSKESHEIDCRLNYEITEELLNFQNALFRTDLSLFKEALYTLLYDFRREYKITKGDSKNWRCLIDDSSTDNAITLAATAGDVKHWQVLEDFYQTFNDRPTSSASLMDTCGLGSPIQAAIKAGKNEMVHYFLNTKDGFDLNKRYGCEKENILHTIVKENRSELFIDLYCRYSNRLSKFFDALIEKNCYGESPLWLALKAKKFGLVDRILNVALRNTQYIHRVLFPELVDAAVEMDAGAIIDKMLDLQEEYNRAQRQSIRVTVISILLPQIEPLIEPHIYIRMHNSKTRRQIKSQMENYYSQTSL